MARHKTFSHHRFHPLPSDADLDAIQEAVQIQDEDPLSIPTGPITRARAKQLKETLSGLVQDTWASQTSLMGVQGRSNPFGYVCFMQAQF